MTKNKEKKLNNNNIKNKKTQDIVDTVEMNF